MSAAEKRAARRARVLQGSENRLKLLNGQISSLKMTCDDLGATSMEKQLDESLAHDSNSESPPTSTKSQKELQIPTRVDPAQRRRDAAARRRKKEGMVAEILNCRTEADVGCELTQMTDAPTKAVSADDVSTAVDPTFSRHLTAFRVYSLEEKLVLLLIVAAAVYCGVHVDLSSLFADLIENDQIFLTYQNLITKGISVESIRQQLGREHMLLETREKLELSLTQQLKIEALGASAERSEAGWIPNVADLGFSISSLMAQPPIVFSVFFVRFIVSMGTKAMLKALNLPNVKNPQEKDLGFLANMALSNRPVLKDFLVKGQKALDDVFVFIFALVVVVAVRAIWVQW